jgi:hypothetical protein
MTKRLSLITALVLSASMSIGAAVPQVNRPLLPEGQESGRVKLNKDIKPMPFANGLQKAQAKKAPQLAKKNGISIGDILTVPQEIITEAPAGTVQQYSRSTDAVYYFYGLWFEHIDNFISEIVFGDDGYVYIKNPISEYATDSYIKGKLEDGIITFNLPQPIYDYNGYTLCADFQKVVVDDEQGTFDYEQAENQKLQYSYKDGVLTQLGDDENIYLALSYDDGSWAGYGEQNDVFTPYKDESLRDVNLEGSEYQFTYIDGDNLTGGHYVTVAKDASNLYIKGLFTASPDTWLKGTLDGDKAIFKTQPAGVISNFAAYFVPTKSEIKSIYYEGYGTYQYTVYSQEDQLVLTYDASKDAYTAEEGSCIAAFTTAEYDQNTSITLESYSNPVISKPGDLLKAVPSDPIISGLYDYTEYYGTTTLFFDFYLSKLSTEGDLLDVNKLYYNVTLDGEPIVFDTDIYDVDDEYIDLPFTYTTEFDIYGTTLFKEISIYSEGFDTIGVQVIYRPEEGVENVSNLVEYAVETGDILTNGEITGVNNIAVDKSVKSEVYYDLTGRRVANPENGLFIKKVTYNDNTVKVSKIAK